MLLNEFNYVSVYIFCFGPHLIIKVGAVERTLVLHCVGNAKVFLNIGLNLFGGRCSERNDRRVANFVDDGTDFPVLRPKVMPPLRNAVRLVDGVKGDFYRFEKRHVVFLRQRFGGNVQQFRKSQANIFFHLLHLRFRERGVDEVRHAVLLAHVPHRVHLIFHQGNERRNHNRRSFHQKRGQLVTHRLAAARRHKHKNIFAVQQAADNGFLIVFERVKAKMAFERFV